MEINLTLNKLIPLADELSETEAPFSGVVAAGFPSGAYNYMEDGIDFNKLLIRMMKVLDFVNGKYGRNTLKFAVMGDGKAWKIKQERLSPCYTTRMSDFPLVN